MPRAIPAYERVDGSGQKLPLSERGLILRINRILQRDRQRLHKVRQPNADTGQFVVVDTDHNALVLKQVNIEAFGRKLGALRPWETLAG